MRARIRDRFAELHTQRTHAEDQLAALAAAKPKAADPDILDELADLLNPGQDGYHDTAAPAPADNGMRALAQPPIGG